MRKRGEKERERKEKEVTNERNKVIKLMIE
jgi:hypothetical protein